jgi:hypothetical protein
MYTPFKSLASPSDVASLLDDDSKLVYPLCDNTLFIISKCVDLDTDDYVGFNNNEATIAGLFIKQVKLFDEFYKAYKNNKLYLCVILQRVIYEAFIKMEYLIKYGNEAQRTFRSYSYKDRNKFYQEHKASKDGYFKIRNNKYLEDIADDGFTIDDIKNSKKSFGGKNFYQLVEEFDDKSLYTSLYGIASDPIHSDWGDIRQLYLQKTPEKNSYIIPEDISIQGHFRYLLPVLDIINSSAIKYIDWSLSIDPSYQKLIYYKNMFTEFRRVYALIMECVFKEYNNDDSKYMYE